MKPLDPVARQFALRMIPYGVFVATSFDDTTGDLAAQTVHWVMQTSITPPLVMVALPVGSELNRVVRASNRIVLHMLGRDDAAEAFAFRAGRVVRERGPAGDFLNGHPITTGRGHVPLLLHAVAVVECRLLGAFEVGDHHPALFEVIDVHVRLPPHRRPDEMIMHLRELGETIFYGG